MTEEKIAKDKLSKLFATCFIIWSIRFCVSILFGDLVYPNTTNFMEAAFYDILPTTIFIILFIFGASIDCFSEIIFKRYSANNKWYKICYFVPLIIIAIIFFYSSYETINSLRNGQIENTPSFSMAFSISKSFADIVNFLSNKVWLGWNCLTIARCIITFFLFVFIAISIYIVLSNFVKIAFNVNMRMKNEKDRYLLTCLSFIILFTNLTSLTLLAIYSSNNLFLDFCKSNNFYSNLFESFYITTGNIFLFTPYSAHNYFGKLLLMFSAMINFLFFTMFLTSLFSKETAEISKNKSKSKKRK